MLSVALFALVRLLSDAPVVRFASSDTAARDSTVADIRSRGARDADLELGRELSRVSPRLYERLRRFRALSAQEKADQLNAGALRYGPYAMLALLPASALLLYASYVGRRSVYPQRPHRYAEHLVFAAHMHAFACLMAMVLLVSRVPGTAYAVTAWCLVYGVVATHRVYGGRWSGVIVRGTLIALSYTVLFGLAVAALVVLATLLP